MSIFKTRQVRVTDTILRIQERGTNIIFYLISGGLTRIRYKEEVLDINNICESGCQ